MSTKPTEPDRAESLNRRLLAASQLQIQATRSVALDASALGVMAVDLAVATTAFGVAYALRILALLLLGPSLGQAVRSLRLPGAKRTGPSVTDTPKALDGKDEPPPDDSLLNDLAEDIEINEHALARKEPSFERALTFLVLAILVELAGRVVQ
ncbi:MAG: hypothetical protein ACRDK7_09965 [Solirubrobacteraceae bacterium]